MEDSYSQERDYLVYEHLKKHGILDHAVLSAMDEVPRHRFVPENMREFAYNDRAIPIGHNQTISQPFIVGFMTQAAKLKPNYRVLEIGTGSGYQCAVLSRIVREVYTIEIIPELAKKSQALFEQLGYENINLMVGDGYEGWKDRAPFDAIIVTAAATKIPDPLLSQLKVGHLMIIPLQAHGYTRSSQRLKSLKMVFRQKISFQ